MDILLKRVHVALTALGVVMLAAALPGAALTLLALSQSEAASAQPQLASAEAPRLHE